MIILILLFPFFGPFLAFLLWRISKWAQRTPEREKTARINLIIAACYSLLMICGPSGYFAVPTVILLCTHTFFFALYTEWQLHREKTAADFPEEVSFTQMQKQAASPWTKFVLVNAAILLAYSVYFGWQATTPDYSDIGVPAMPEFAALLGWGFVFFFHFVFALAIGLAIRYEQKKIRLSKNQHGHV